MHDPPEPTEGGARRVSPRAVGATQHELSRIGLLATLSGETLTKLAAQMTREELPAGAGVVSEGEAGDRFYVVLSGMLSVSQSSRGAQSVLRPGDYFGEVALAMHMPRTASVRALTPVTVASCDRETFDRIHQASVRGRRMSVWHDVHGEGPAVVLVHAGIADSRMWEPQLALLFGLAYRSSRRPAGIRELADRDESGHLSAEPSPTRSTPQVSSGRRLSAPRSVGWSRSTSRSTRPNGSRRSCSSAPASTTTTGRRRSQAFDAAEEAALERGDLDAAVNANRRLLARRSHAARCDDVDPNGPRARCPRCNVRPSSNRKGHDDLRDLRLDPPASQRLGDVACSDTRRHGRRGRQRHPRDRRRLAADIPGAERATHRGCGTSYRTSNGRKEFDRIVPRGFLYPEVVGARHDA